MPAFKHTINDPIVKMLRWAECSYAANVLLLKGILGTDFPCRVKQLLMIPAMNQSTECV